MSDDSILIVEQVGHAYGNTPVLTGVSFTLQPGEFLAILGASGCGKSTLLRAIAGFVCARDGRITLGTEVMSENGHDHVRAEKRAVGLVFQDYALFPHMTVAENIAFGIHREPDKSARINALLELVDLKGFGPRHPNSLSGGQKQRVALARALAPRPKLLLLDEPFANLDGPIRMDVGHAIKGILRKAGAAGILVTHDRSEAMGLADRVAVLGRPDGRVNGPAELLQLDTPDRLFHTPNSRRVAQLTGQAIFLTGQADRGIASTIFGPLQLEESAHGEVDIMLREYQLVFELSENGSARVLDCQFVGPGYRLLMDTEIGRVWLPHPSACPLGARGSFSVLGRCVQIR